MKLPHRCHCRFIPLLCTSLVVAIVLAAPGGNVVRGTITAKGNGTCDIKADGDQQAIHYSMVPPGMHVDQKITDYMNGLPVGTQVEITWQMYSNTRVIFKLTAFQGGAASQPANAADMVVGTVTALQSDKKKPMWIEVKDDHGHTEQYWPRWIGKAFDPDMVHAISERNVGDRVEIKMAKDDHVRAVTMRLLMMSPNPTTMPGGEGGAFVGKVMEKGQDWIAITGPDGIVNKYMPQRVVGANEMDRDVVQAIAGVSAGQTVKARWFRDGERRLYSLKAAATTAPAKGGQTGPPERR